MIYDKLIGVRNYLDLYTLVFSPPPYNFVYSKFVLLSNSFSGNQIVTENQLAFELQY